MPVDDDSIDSKILELRIKATALNKQGQKIENIINAFRSIQMQKSRVDEMDDSGNPTARIVERIPEDIQTHKEMTPARRQDIFNTNMTDADVELAKMT